jgi:hypothetical protein
MYMASLYLNDILKRNGVDPKRTILIRHSLNHKRCKSCYENNFIEDYQKIQSKSFFNNCDFVLSFISEPGTSAKFIGFYKVGSRKPIKTTFMPIGFPVPEMFSEDEYFFDLEPLDIMADLKNRLIIEWGKATVSWKQRATNEKAVIAIQTNPKYSFLGYDKTVLNYTELKEIMTDKILYENWHTALASVYAIYLITDKTDGKQYVGSAYGDGGLLNRWKCYIDNKHGGNKKLKEVICNYPERYENFQFSILQILPKTITQEEVNKIETQFKRKLLSKEFGLNAN